MEERTYQFHPGEKQAIFERLDKLSDFLAHHADLGASHRDPVNQAPVAQRGGGNQACANYRCLLDLAERALARGVKKTDGSNNVLFQFQADGIVMERREDIDDSSAHTKIPWLFRLRHPLITHRRQRLDQRVEIE